VESIQSVAASVEPWQRPSVDERLNNIAKRDGLKWELSVAQLERGKSTLLKEILGKPSFAGMMLHGYVFSA
jgi:hypothetical protein